MFNMHKTETEFKKKGYLWYKVEGQLLEPSNSFRAFWHFFYESL